jgi:DNA-binding response OmpR family regulator
MAKILVVDDERETAELVGLLLGREGHQVKTVYDGPGALAELARETPDVIVLDVTMPGMDGYTLVTQLQADEASRDIPVIVLTGREGLKDTFQLFTNVADFLTKPFDAKDLRLRVANALAKRAAG